MLIQYLIKQKMSEKLHTPSQEFSNRSTNRDIEQGIPFDERKLNVLDSLEAAYAAKPYMDAAVDLVNAYQENEGGRGESMDNIIKESPGLESLIRFAEAKAHQAVENGEVSVTTGPEEIVLSAYAAEADMERAQTKCDYDNLMPDDLHKVADVAYSRSKSLQGRERTRMSDMEQRLHRFATFLETGGADDEDIRKEFRADTTRAAQVLDSNTATVRPTEYVRVSEVRQDANWMRGQAEMYEFLSEFYPKHDASVENNIDKRNPHINEAESRAEASERIYGSSELLTELLDESIAFADFVTDTPELNTMTPDLNRFRRDLPEIMEAVENWKQSGSDIDFRSYLEQVEEADAGDQAWNAAKSAKAALRNQIWRESEMSRRMNAKIEDKREVGAREQFRINYFA